MARIGLVAITLFALTAVNAKAETIKVSLADNAIEIDQPSEKAGKIDFVVTNDSATEVHEMIVMAKPTGEVPYDAVENSVIESKVKRFGEVSDIKFGAAGKLAVALKPGDYMLICNNKGALHGRYEGRFHRHALSHAVTRYGTRPRGVHLVLPGIIVHQ